MYFCWGWRCLRIWHLPLEERMVKEVRLNRTNFELGSLEVVRYRMGNYLF